MFIIKIKLAFNKFCILKLMIDALLVFSICTFDNKHLFMMKLYQSNKNVYVQKEKG